ncbi:class I tRNA ligase family protein, partial [Patescibacteria group bacterium]|nr:class I tRNA ligase family protein [Patescibacteria group bacterium]
ILIRWKRMQGFKTLWLPGTDHAGIATQNVVEKKLRKQGLTRFDLGREKFIKEVWEWKEKYGDIILNQFKKLGASCDWSRTRFTMDKEYAETVKQAFLHYYKKAWIYQGERTVNWCPRCSTSLSDLEIVYKEKPAKMYYIKYGPITIATTRPETKLGDTAIAVNPKDARYKKYIDKTITIKTVLGPAKMKVIGDKMVDMKFGTGAMKITPAHDILDFEIGERHGLERKQVIGPDGRMTKLADKYAGMTVAEARKQIVKDMEKIGILEKTEPYTHNSALCYRCDTVIEPILSKQWFLKMNELAKMAEKPVKQGKIKFHPKSFEKPYFDWLKNIKDWCISRQIWWGHKIPIKGETDVLDTWFSSALWPFTTKNFYPTDVLTTGRDIINLWVARMIFSGIEFKKEIPFKHVYIHATILTKEGKRMSKSLGTGIDPINLINEFGADATRFGIAYQIMGNQDMKFVKDNIVMGKKFCNKIWNATRYVLKESKEKELGSFSKKEPSSFSLADRKILKQLDKTIKFVDKDLENFKFGKAAHTLYDFFWHDFCDVYIEASKKQDNKETQEILFYVLLSSLKLLHPFIPFITEEIYQKLSIKDKKKSLMIEKWPKG